MQDVTLYQPPGRPWTTPNMSPFCAKLECYLRMANVPHKLGKVKFTKAPKGKIPFVDLGDGALMGDSQLIIEELERRLAAEGKPTLDGGLSKRDAATGHLVRRALEEGFYFVGIYNRWKTDAGYKAVAPEFKKFVPSLAVPLIRRSIVKKLHGQGTGRHTPDEAMAIGGADWDAIAELLGDRPYLLGDAPHIVDCAVFAFLVGVVHFPVDSAVRAKVLAHANLVKYEQRIRDKWWKDLA